jgi:hypothetical protein
MRLYNAVPTIALIDHDEGGESMRLEPLYRARFTYPEGWSVTLAGTEGIVGRRQIVGAATHLSEHERYRWLNDVVCVVVGEVRTIEGDAESRGQAINTIRPTMVELVIDVAELVSEPILE